jgi:L-iditol 2-dehydrogenase
MNALRLHAYNQFEFVDVSIPTIDDDEVLIRVHSCGICGSDVHGMDGSSGRRIPPIIMGHEAAGVIDRVGSRVLDWKVGDRVTFDSTIYCGECWFCRRGDINLCDQRRVLGVSCADYRQHGAYAEYVAVPQRILYRLPEGMSFDHAAMVEPISIALHAVSRTPISVNDSAVVVGTGMIGLLVVQALRLAGCGQIIAVDLDDRKLERAKSLGADLGINSKNNDVVAEVAALTGGRGADIAMEVVGIAPTVNLAIKSVRKGGSVTLVGNLAPGVEMPLQAIVTRELSLYGSCSSRGEYQASLDMIARGAIQVEPLISQRVPLSEGAEWFDRLYRNEPDLMKVIVHP